jgi:hypothetical protein
MMPHFGMRFEYAGIRHFREAPLRDRYKTDFLAIASR